MSKQDLYTTFDVVRILDIKMERLQDWLKRGYIKPVHQEPVGRGMKNFFSKLQLYALHAFRYLVENGITRNEAAKWVEKIYEDFDFHTQLSKIEGEADQDGLHAGKPTFLVFYKGYSSGKEKDLVYISRSEKDKVILESNMNTDSIHIINFNKIIKFVDARLES